MISLYRDLLKEAWHIAWRHKFLWFFGLFAALLGNGGEYEILFHNVDTVSRQQAIIYNLQHLSSTGRLQMIWDNITSYFINNTLSSILVMILVLAIFVFIVWLVIVSQIGLIDSSFKLQANQGANLESGFRAGRKYFLPIFLLNLISRVIIYGLLIAIGTPLILTFLTRGTAFWNTVFIICSFLILVPLAIIVSFIIKYASAYVVFKQEKIGNALKYGLRLFTKNWLVSIEMALVILLINLLFGLAMIILVGLVSIPFVLLGVILYVIGALAPFYILALIGTVVLLILIFIIGAFISAFQWVAWMLLFKRLVEGKGISKIIRMFSRVPNYLGKT